MNAALSSDLSTGAVFAGRYRVERRIAVGGMGAVYEVVHIETNRRRALKVMHAHFVSNDELRGRFRQEARIAAEIDSEHIVDVFDAGIDDETGMPYLVMELLRGEELGKRVKRIGALPADDVVRYLYETSLALDKTHRARIVHRDLKPDNLFLCDRERGPSRVKVLDFGIAKIVKDAEAQANHTRSLGTPLYMAPEQFLVQGSVSPATDIFALGLIAFTLLAGKPYWHMESVQAGEVMAFALHVSTGPRESAVARARDLFGVALPSAFDAWFFRATACDPAARFATAGDAVFALADVLDVPLQGGVSASRPHVGVTGGLTPDLAYAPVLVPSASGATPVGHLPTGPTPMAVSPIDTSSMARRHAARTRPLIFMASAVTVLVGLGLWLVLKALSGQPPVKPVQNPAQAAVLTSSSAAMPDPVSSAVEADRPSPVAPAPSTSRPTVHVMEPAASSPVRTIVKPIAPAVSANKPPVKSVTGGHAWTDD